MKLATISHTKNNLSALLDRVRHGETILIMDRDTPVARLEPVVGVGEPNAQGRLARLERMGVVKRGRDEVAQELLRQPPPKPKGGVDVLAALLAERREGR
jgi:antitoxin (DNA-binding transcriptional repressor) of toxin-antitoxin stability system